MGDAERIISKLTTVLSNFNEVENQINFLTNQLLDASCSNHCDFSSAESCVDNILESSNKCIVALKEISSCFELSVPWLPDISEESYQLRFLDGSNPWSFWLKADQKSNYESLQTKIWEKFNSGKLQKYSTSPNVGSYIICVDRKNIFRGLVLASFLDKIKVLNVDEGISKVIKLENIYAISGDLCEPCAFSIPCCLTQEKSLEKFWNSDLGDLFKNTLRECNLSVKFTDKLGCVPPKFLVEIQGHYEEMECLVDVNEWIFQRLFPILEGFSGGSEVDIDQLPESVLYPYAVNSNLPNDLPREENSNVISQNGSNNLSEVLSPIKVSDKSQQVPWSSSLISNSGVYAACYSQIIENPQGRDKVISQCAFFGYGDPKVVNPFINQNSQLVHSNSPSPVETNNSINLKPLISNSLLNAYSVPFEPSKKQELVTSVASSTKDESPVVRGNEAISTKDESPVVRGNEAISTKDESPVVEEVKEVTSNKDEPSKVEENKEICPNYSSKGFCLKENCDKLHSRLKPIEKGEVNGKCDEIEENSIEHDAAMEEVFEPYLNGGYEPTDEKRICKFFSRDGTCWKRRCRKEHILPIPNKWTMDQEEMYVSAFNDLCLPEVGTTIDVKVNDIISSRSFYGNLPDECSDIGEHVENHETYALLLESLNRKGNEVTYEPLQVDPCPSQLFIGYTSERLWKRVQVMESTDTKASVFLVDEGFLDEIPRKHLRKIEAKYLHLPFQAVKFNLYNTYSVDETSDINGKAHLASRILNKIVSATVEERNLSDGSLNVTVKSGGVNINKEIVFKGFCDSYF